MPYKPIMAVSQFNINILRKVKEVESLRSLDDALTFLTIKAGYNAADLDLSQLRRRRKETKKEVVRNATNNNF